MARLHSFVNALTAALCVLLSVWVVPVSAAESAADRTWQFQSNPDPFGSGYVAVARTDAGTMRPMVRCWTEAATVDVRFSLTAEQSLPVTDQVRIVFDSQQPMIAEWSRNATRLALVVPAQLQRALLAKLRQSNEMRLTLGTAGGGESTHVIALDGSALAIDQALASCTQPVT